MICRARRRINPVFIMNASLFVDIFLGAVFVFCVYTGVKNGFVRALASLAATGVALAVAFVCTSHWAGPVSEALLTPGLTGFLEDKLSPGGSDTLLAISEKLTDGLDGLLHGGAAQKTAGSDAQADGAEENERDLGSAIAGEDESEEEAVEASATLSLSQTVASAFGNAIASFLMFFILFALVLAILRVLIDQLRIVNRIPIVGLLNRVLGFVLGAGLGLFLLYIPIWLVCSFLPSAFPGQTLISPETLRGSHVLSFLMGFYPGSGGAGGIRSV